MKNFDLAKTLFFEGVACYEQNQFEQAEIKFRESLEQIPDRLSTITNLSVTLIKLKKIEAAEELCLKAISLDGNSADAWNNLGLIAREKAKPIEAIGYFEKALLLDQTHAGAWNNKGVTLNELGRFDDALACFNKALAINPEFADAFSNRSRVLNDLKCFAEALDNCDRAIELKPELPEAHSNRGLTLIELKRLDEALESCDRAIALKPDYPVAWNNRGMALHELKRWHEALTSYYRALQIKPDYAEAHLNLSLCYLLLEDFARGWPEYEWRWQSREISQKLAADRARFARDWDGHALQGTLLVLPEQGVGDEIFYSGMLNDLRSRVPSVTVCVNPRLIRLYERSFADMTFVAKAALDPGQPFAAQVYMASLGRYFRGSPDALKGIKLPYLRADADRAARLRARIKDGDRLLCGLSWVSKNADFGADKSLNLQDLAPLLSLPHADFVDLQYGDTGAEQAALATATGITLKRVAEIDNFNDIDGLAALIEACDIVVTVSNTTAHLAAALGKPVLMMLPHSMGLLWYWHVDREDSVWYPGARLFRQDRIGDWTGVIERVRQALLQR